MAASLSRPDPSSPASVAEAGFSTARRGFSQDEVRAFLTSVAAELGRLQERERQLEAQLAEVRAEAATVPEIDEETITAMVGEETLHVLQTARESASQIKIRAEESAAKILRDANDEVNRLRQDAEVELARRRHDAAADAESEVALAKQQGREMVNEARSYRERVLADLDRRSRLARQQIDELGQGRDRLLQVFERARLVAVDITSELQSIDGPAEFVDLSPTTGPVPMMVPGDARGPARASTAEAPAAPDETRDDGAADADDPQRDDSATGDEAPAPESAGSDDGNDRAPDDTDDDAAEAAADVDVDALADSDRDDDSDDDGEHTDDADDTDAGDDADLAATEADPPHRPPRDANVVSLFGDRVPDGDAAERAGSGEHDDPNSGTDAGVPADAAGAHDDDDGDDRSTASDLDDADDPAIAAEAADDAATDDPAADATDDVGGTAAGDGDAERPDVNGIFERLRSETAERDDSSSDAEERSSDDATATSTDAETSPFGRRDEAIVPLIVAGARKLKRVLADEQNGVLDLLRQRRPVTTSEELLPDLDAHLATYVDALGDDLVEAAVAGAGEVGKRASTALRTTLRKAALDESHAIVRDDLVMPLRARLERAVVDGAGDNEEIAKRIRAVYREWKTQHIDHELDDVFRFAFGGGVAAGVKPGTPLAWVIDASEPTCADCEDNSLAGTVRAGDTFPTGHTSAPAHPGCRCLTVPGDQ